MVFLALPLVLAAAAGLLYGVARVYAWGWRWSVDHFGWLGVVGFVLVAPAAGLYAVGGLVHLTRWAAGAWHPLAMGVGHGLQVLWFAFLFWLLSRRVASGRAARERRRAAHAAAAGLNAPSR